MSYYKYLRQYHPGFLRKYQCETYTSLGRSARYAEIVHMNATSTLSIDEDLTLRMSVPLNITNFLAFMSLVYWYFYHIDMYAANSLKNRLRSYYNYKMWSRLEISVYKNNVKAGQKFKELLFQNRINQIGLTIEQYNELGQRVDAGEDMNKVLKSWGLKVDRVRDKFVKA